MLAMILEPKVEIHQSKIYQYMVYCNAHNNLHLRKQRLATLIIKDFHQKSLLSQVSVTIPNSERF